MEKTISEHLKDLKKEFIWIMFPAVVIFVAIFATSGLIIRFLIKSLELSEISMVTLTPFEGLNTVLTISGMITLILCIPLLLLALYRFSKPSLSDRVIRATKYYLLGSFFTAIFGMFFGIFIFAPMVLSTLNSSYQIADSMWGIKSVLSFVMFSGLSMALAMQIIVILPALNNMKFLNIRSLKKRRITIALGILIVSAVITPPDVISQIFMFVPFYGSFELGMLFCKKTKGGKNVGLK